jgi:hypothetical protein
MRQTDRIQISAPVFLSTTNVQTLNAPDVATAHKLRKVSSVSSHSSSTSDKDSDGSSIPSRSRGASITDNSSVGSSPSSPKPGDSPSQYFGAKPASPRKAKSSFDLKDRARAQGTIPPLPIRAPSHSKFAHEQLARKRSLQTLKPNNWQPPPRSVPAVPPVPPLPTENTNRERRTSVEIFNSHQTGGSHPFGSELKQLDQVAEEFGGVLRNAANQEDMKVMDSRGLKRFCADDYMRDLEPLFSHYFLPQPMMVGWL